MDEKTTYRLQVIAEPGEGTRTVFTFATLGPAFKSGGPRTYQCGTCGKTLIHQVNAMQFLNIVFKCGKCGGFNEIRTAHQAD